MPRREPNDPGCLCHGTNWGSACEEFCGYVNPDEEDMDEMQEEDFGGAGDETPYWPPIGSPDWYRRQTMASAQLRQAEREIYAHCAEINVAVTKLFRELKT